MIQITDNAAKAIQQSLMDEGKNPEQDYLRVAVQGGGCSGMTYKLDFTNDLAEGDEVYTHEGIKVVVDHKSMLFLHGLTLDFTSGLNG
jgi:iron-sulfur cluster assembly protein